MLTFEVRVPTYNRPDLLLRALESLRAQTYPHWVARVYDDASSGEEVVKSVADRRIEYYRNANRLGATQNIDHCFSPSTRSGGHYGCLLEDDNFWMPGLLSSVAKHIETHPWQLIQTNQRIWSEGRGLHPDTETTFGDWFSPGVVEPDRLWISRLFDHGVSNGGLFWKLNGECNLQVGHTIKNAGIQELCRSLLVRSPLLFIKDALAVFMYAPKEATARCNEDNRLFGRGQQSIRRFILERFGAEAVKTILIEKPEMKDHIVWLLAHSGYPHLIESCEIVSPSVLKAYFKGIALRLTQPDPCSDFLDELR
jgi:glycosyltransferase involved in cell wall biosynthesis